MVCRPSDSIRSTHRCKTAIHLGQVRTPANPEQIQEHLIAHGFWCWSCGAVILVSDRSFTPNNPHRLCYRRSPPPPRHSADLVSAALDGVGDRAGPLFEDNLYRDVDDVSQRYHHECSHVPLSDLISISRLSCQVPTKRRSLSCGLRLSSWPSGSTARCACRSIYVSHTDPPPNN